MTRLPPLSVRRAANQAVQVAKKTGRLVRQACERCQSDDTIAHHEEYSRPLDVIWLCHKCHKARHRELGWGIYGRRRPINLARIKLPDGIRLGIRREELSGILGSEHLARELIHSGWLTPIIQRKKLTLFAMSHLAAVIERLTKRQRPPRIRRRK